MWVRYLCIFPILYGYVMTKFPCNLYSKSKSQSCSLIPHQCQTSHAAAKCVKYCNEKEAKTKNAEGRINQNYRCIIVYLISLRNFCLYFHPNLFSRPIKGILEVLPPGAFRWIFWHGRIVSDQGIA